MPSVPSASVLVLRHSLVTRLTHWINVLALLVLLTSGLQIFNAHPALYWGDTSTFARPWAAMATPHRPLDTDRSPGNAFQTVPNRKPRGLHLLRRRAA